MGEQQSIQEFDEDEIIAEVVDLFQSRPDWCGFKNEEQIRNRFQDGNVYFSHQNGELVAALDFNHTNKGYTVVYNSVVRDISDHRPFWEGLVNRVLRESKWNRIITRVPEDVEEILLWRRLGKRVTMEPGKNRRLVVFEVLGDETTSSTEPIDTW